MRKDIRRRHEAQSRANGVCAEYSALFDATPGGQKTRAALGTWVADVDHQLAVQERSIAERRAMTEQCRAARRAARSAAKGVVKVGKLVNLDETTMAALQIPGSVSDEELIAWGRGLLDQVSAYADAFVAEGLPPDLLKNLDARIQGLVAARDARAAARQQFAAASESIRASQDRADKTIEALEAIAANLSGADPDVLAKLRVAKRVGPHTDSRGDATPKPEPASPPAPPPTTPSDKTA